jgi:transposase
LQDACRRDLSKGGLEAAAIGCSRGGLTTNIHDAVDALGLPIRFLITPGHWGDYPQARGLIARHTGVGQFIMDAGYNADHLRNFMTDELGAVPHIKQNPSRSGQIDIDLTL